MANIRAGKQTATPNIGQGIGLGFWNTFVTIDGASSHVPDGSRHAKFQVLKIDIAPAKR